MSHIHTQPFWECECEASKEANRKLQEAIDNPAQATCLCGKPIDPETQARMMEEVKRFVMRGGLDE